MPDTTITGSKDTILLLYSPYLELTSPQPVTSDQQSDQYRFSWAETKSMFQDVVGLPKHYTHVACPKSVDSSALPELSKFAELVWERASAAWCSKYEFEAGQALEKMMTDSEDGWNIKPPIDKGLSFAGLGTRATDYFDLVAKHLQPMLESSFQDLKQDLPSGIDPDTIVCHLVHDANASTVEEYGMTDVISNDPTLVVRAKF